MEPVDVLIITALAEEYDAALAAGARGYGPNPGVASWEEEPTSKDDPSRFTYDEGKQAVEGFQGDHRQTPMLPTWLRSAQDLSPKGLHSHGEPSPKEDDIGSSSC